jgi:hypothetical protein
MVFYHIKPPKIGFNQEDSKGLGDGIIYCGRLAESSLARKLPSADGFEVTEKCPEEVTKNRSN